MLHDDTIKALRIFFGIIAAILVAIGFVIGKLIK